MQIGGSSFVCLLTSLNDNDTARYPVHPLCWMGVKLSKLISTFDTFLLSSNIVQQTVRYIQPIVPNQYRKCSRSNCKWGNKSGWILWVGHTSVHQRATYTKAHQNQQYWLSSCFKQQDLKHKHFLRQSVLRTMESGMLECLLQMHVTVTSCPSFSGYTLYVHALFSQWILISS